MRPRPDAAQGLAVFLAVAGREPFLRPPVLRRHDPQPAARPAPLPGPTDPASPRSRSAAAVAVPRTRRPSRSSRGVAVRGGLPRQRHDGARRVSGGIVHLPSGWCCSLRLPVQLPLISWALRVSRRRDARHNHRVTVANPSSGDAARAAGPARARGLAELAALTPTAHLRRRQTDPALLALFDAMAGSRLLDIEARRMRERGEGYLHDRLGRARVERAGRQRPAADATRRCCTTAPARSTSPGRCRPAARLDDALRAVLLGLAAASSDPASGGRHKVFGDAELGDHPADLDDRLAPAARGRHRLRDRPGRSASG